MYADGEDAVMIMRLRTQGRRRITGAGGADQKGWKENTGRDEPLRGAFSSLHQGKEGGAVRMWKPGQAWWQEFEGFPLL